MIVIRLADAMCHPSQSQIGYALQFSLARILWRFAENWFLGGAALLALRSILQFNKGFSR
jgi:hypothetical protein